MNDYPWSLEELKHVCERLEQRLLTAADEERPLLERRLECFRELLVKEQETLLGKLETIVHDPRFEGSAPPLVSPGKLQERVVNLLQRLGIKRKT